MAQPGDGDYIPQHAAEIEWGEWGPRQYSGHFGYIDGDYQFQRINGEDQWRYPVKREPKVETVVLYGSIGYGWAESLTVFDTHRVTLTIVDGKPTSFGPVEEL